MRGAGADAAQATAEAPLHRPMQMSAEQAFHLRMAGDDLFQRRGIDERFAVHVTNSADKRRMVQDQ